jgi:hypothetical protein
MGDAAYNQGDVVQATALYQEVLALFREAGLKDFTA